MAGMDMEPEFEMEDIFLPANSPPPGPPAASPEKGTGKAKPPQGRGSWESGGDKPPGLVSAGGTDSGQKKLGATKKVGLTYELWLRCFVSVFVSRGFI